MTYGTAPKDRGLIGRLFFPKIKRPSYVRPRYFSRDKNDLDCLLIGQSRLAKQGVVTLAAIIQANGLLYKSGRFDSPAELLVSLDASVTPEMLSQIRDEVASLKNAPAETLRDEASTQISKHLSNEHTRFFGLPVPAKISNGHECFCTTTIIRRKSLPDGFLVGDLVPVLFDSSTFHVVILPYQYWSPAGHEIYRKSGF